jgi:hypothetical protein
MIGAVCAGHPMKLHHIRPPHETQSKRTEFHPERRPQIPPGLGSTGVHTLMEDPALGRVEVLLPELLHMNQGTLPFTKKQVLERRDG